MKQNLRRKPPPYNLADPFKIETSNFRARKFVDDLSQLRFFTLLRDIKKLIGSLKKKRRKTSRQMIERIYIDVDIP